MTDIDRRSLMTIAGASLALAGCSDDFNKGRKDRNASKFPNPSATGRGVCPVYGDTPNKPSPFSNFAPEYIRVVYIRFANGTMIGLQGYVVNPTKKDLSDDDLKKSVTDLITKLRNNSGYDINNIDIVSCGSPLILLIFIDNDKKSEISFADEFSGENIIRFTDQNGKFPYKERMMNKAFYDLHYIEFEDFGSGRSAYRLSFWSKDSSGNDIKMAQVGNASTYSLFSMNIHLKVPGASSDSWVPLVIDPDTGNMGSNP